MPIPTLVKKTAKEYTPCPEGSFQGKLVRIYYVGTQIDTYNPTYKPQGKLILVFELDEPVPGGNGNFRVFKKISTTLNEKSGFYKLFKPVLGSSYPNENGSFNPEQLLSMRVLVNVTHTVKGDKTYTDISSLGRIPRGMVPFEPECDEFCWSYDDPPKEGVPQWVLDLAAKCIEITGEEPPKVVNHLTKVESQAYKQSNSLAHQQAKMAAAGFKPQAVFLQPPAGDCIDVTDRALISPAPAGAVSTNDNDLPEGTPY